MHIKDAVMLDNWVLEGRLAMNQHLMIRRLEDSGKVCDSNSQQNILHMPQFDVDFFTRTTLWAAISTENSLTLLGRELRKITSGYVFINICDCNNPKYTFETVGLKLF